MRRLPSILTLWILSATAPGMLAGQESPSAGEPLTAEPEFERDGWMDLLGEIGLRLGRPLEPEDGRRAVLVGEDDVSGFLESDGDRISYQPRQVALAPGGSEVVVYRVLPGNDWEELVRFAIRVRTVGNFETLALSPKLALGNAGLLAERSFPALDAPNGRDTYQDFTGQLGIEGRAVRNGFDGRLEGNLAGVSQRNEALRFAEKGADAPRFDLSRYRAQAERGQTGVQLGHISHGRHRHLINSFGSRGMMLETGMGRRADLSLAALNGTSVVGWNNLLGLGDPSHRILSGTAGLDVLPAGIGDLRVEASFVRPDMFENVMELQANVGPLSAQLTRNRSEDNLDDVPSILKTRTGQSSLRLSLPVSNLVPPSGASPGGGLSRTTADAVHDHAGIEHLYVVVPGVDVIPVESGPHDLGRDLVGPRHPEHAVRPDPHPPRVQLIQEIGAHVPDRHPVDVRGLHAEAHGADLDPVADHQSVVRVVRELDHHVLYAAVLPDDGPFDAAGVPGHDPGAVAHLCVDVEPPLLRIGRGRDAHGRLHVVPGELHRRVPHPEVVGDARGAGQRPDGAVRRKAAGQSGPPGLAPVYSPGATPRTPDLPASQSCFTGTRRWENGQGGTTRAGTFGFVTAGTNFFAGRLGRCRSAYREPAGAERVGRIGRHPR